MELVASAVLSLLGIALTSAGVLTHTAPLVAPGAVLTLGGGSWLGNALARRGVRLFPTPTRDVQR